MKFSTREDIEAPIDFVFAQVTDFDAFTRSALRHGAEITTEHSGPADVGAQWFVNFTFRGRARKLTLRMTQLDVPGGYTIEAVSDGMTAISELTLVALSPRRTRLAFAIDVRAKTLTARLLLQSMKLAKGKLTKRFKARVLDFAEDVEDRYRKAG
ncbi:SRPBCC family protein [Yoonia sp. BS5-3]|uniref:SRPBCC family protein n=1 Tax=Yoonia phaeophyticola TaxID=3137369 RepID=A0ABZ2V5H8_9RHOB